MGKGGYNGGSTVVGFGGSGWVGRGSVTMQPSEEKQRSKKSKGRSKASDKKAARATRPIMIPAALAGDEKLQRLEKRVRAIEADIKAAQSRMGVLTRQLQFATDQLRAGITAKARQPNPKTNP